MSWAKPRDGRGSEAHSRSIAKPFTGGIQGEGGFASGRAASYPMTFDYDFE
jgi:hypothetical protein